MCVSAVHEIALKGVSVMVVVWTQTIDSYCSRFGRSFTGELEYHRGHIVKRA